MADMANHLTDVILDLERDYLHDTYVKTAKMVTRAVRRPLSEDELMDIHSAAHGLVVEQTCTPLVTIDNLVQVFEYGLYDQKTFGEEVFHHFGLAPTKMKITPLKRTRELEMDQQKLAETSAKDQTEQGEKKLKIEEKTAKSNAELGSKKLELDAKKPKAAKPAKK